MIFQIRKNNLAKVAGAVRDELSKVVIEAANEVVALAEQSIDNGEKTGRVYHIGGETAVTFNAGESGDDGPGANREKTVVFNKGKKGKEHQASAPGEAPATDTGNLVNSMTIALSSDRLTATVTDNAKYAAALEFGSESIEARPYIGPALEKVAETFYADCAAAVTKGITEGSN